MKKFIAFSLSVALLFASVPHAFASTEDFSTPVPIRDPAQTVRNIDTTPSPNTGTEFVSIPDENFLRWVNEGLYNSDEEYHYYDEYTPNLNEECDDLYAEDSARASWVYLDPFTYYGQESNNTCTAACTRMAMKWLTGLSISEATIVKEINTPGTFLDARDYLNTNQTSHKYSYISGMDEPTFRSVLYTSIKNDAPPIVAVKMKTSNGWPYDFNSHALIVYSAMSDRTEFAICDPWAGYVGDREWEYYDKDANPFWYAFAIHGGGCLY